jgi:hypothetical protein
MIILINNLYLAQKAHAKSQEANEKHKGCAHQERSQVPEERH